MWKFQKSGLNIPSFFPNLTLFHFFNSIKILKNKSFFFIFLSKRNTFSEDSQTKNDQKNIKNKKSVNLKNKKKKFK